MMSINGGEAVHYIEVTLGDIETANRLAHEVLGRSLDELAPQTRRLLMPIEEMVTEACQRLCVARSDYRFTRREMRKYTGWSYEQVRVHLDRLVDQVLPQRNHRPFTARNPSLDTRAPNCSG
jgi:hypothetical protein